MSMQELVSVSRRYGGDPDYVVAGGGNSSWKDAASLWIKGSGSSLADIEASGFVRMDRARLDALWDKSYPVDSEARESAVLADLMAARAPGEEAKRPSVETLLHALLPFSFVVHTHPALVNGLTCAAGGEAAMRELFGAEAIWIPSANPGYVLALLVKDAVESFRDARGEAPALIFLQNHGIFVGADTVAGIDALYGRVMAGIARRVGRKPELSGAVPAFGPSAEVAGRLGRLGGEGGQPAATAFRRDKAIAGLVADEASFSPLASPYSPDHIVYAGSDFLFVDAGASPGEAEALAATEKAWKDFAAAKGRKPKTVALRGVGVFGVGQGAKAAGLALELFLDAVKVSVYVESFGGPRFMTRAEVDFINNWEVERYRSKISTGAAGPK